MEILILLVTVVITSAIVLFLIQSGVIAVKAENEQVPVLNTEFIIKKKIRFRLKKLEIISIYFIHSHVLTLNFLYKLKTSLSKILRPRSMIFMWPLVGGSKLPAQIAMFFIFSSFGFSQKTDQGLTILARVGQGKSRNCLNLFLWVVFRDDHGFIRHQD